MRRRLETSKTSKNILYPLDLQSHWKRNQFFSGKDESNKWEKMQKIYSGNDWSFDGTGLLSGNQYAHCDSAVESSSSLSTGTSFNGTGLVELAGVFTWPTAVEDSYWFPYENKQCHTSALPYYGNLENMWSKIVTWSHLACKPSSFGEHFTNFGCAGEVLLWLGGRQLSERQSATEGCYPGAPGDEKWYFKRIVSETCLVYLKGQGYVLYNTI